LYRFHRQGQPPLCLKEKINGTATCVGLCENCPSRSKFRQLQDLVNPLPELPAQRSSYAESTRAQPTDTVKKGGLKIAPRQRRNFKKLTIEIRPPKFKKKLWFGTYEPEDVDRAEDAINFYMGYNNPYKFPDSPLIFAQHKLGIEYRELQPSCEQFIKVGGKKIRKSAFFARSVKEVIQRVTGKKKKGQQRRQQVTGKNGAKKEASPEPVLSCASGVTSLPCASDCASAMVWDDTPNAAAAAVYGASPSEANSELATTVHLPPCQGEIPFESQQAEYLDLDLVDPDLWLDFPDELNPPVQGEFGMMEDNGSFSFPLWN